MPQDTSRAEIIAALTPFVGKRVTYSQLKGDLEITANFNGISLGRFKRGTVHVALEEKWFEVEEPFSITLEATDTQVPVRPNYGLPVVQTTKEKEIKQVRTWEDIEPLD